MSGDESPRIVVGIDGSEPSKRALRWAVRQAELLGGRVDAVAAWEYQDAYVWLLDTSRVRYDDEANAMLTKTIEEVLGSEPVVEVRPQVRHGDPATMLLEVADGAALLVVGNRGHGAFVGAFLGSVSFRCVHHANCPVVVVHGRGD
ncbi:MAG: universal stress protein [Streptosporangiales bacterium]|nr:universal stress protein [Streptosporangiales bacterium]